MSTLIIKRHDTARKFIDHLTVDGSDLNLTGSTVVLAIRRRDGYVRRRTATITSAATGEIEYEVDAVDVAEAGNYDLEWEVTFSDGTQLTFPSTGYHVLRVVEDLE